VSAAISKGMIPVPWDAGGEGDGNMTVFHRSTGAVFDLGLLNAIRSGAGLPKLSGDTSLVTTGANAMKILYSAKDSGWGQVDLGVAKANISAYDSIIVRAYVNGTTSYDSAGTAKNGFVSLSIVTMSNSWTWREASLGSPTLDAWVNYGIAIGTDTTNKKLLVPADPTKLDFFGMQAYSKGYRGTIYVDWIVFKNKSGTSDTLYPFDQSVPTSFSGNVNAIKSIATSAVASDQEWKTATTSAYGTTSIGVHTSVGQNGIRTFLSGSSIHAAYTVQAPGAAQATLKNLLGETVWSHSFQAEAGENTFEIPINQRGLMVLQIQQGSRSLIGKIYCH